MQIENDDERKEEEVETDDDFKIKVHNLRKKGKEERDKLKKKHQYQETLKFTELLDANCNLTSGMKEILQIIFEKVSEHFKFTYDQDGGLLTGDEKFLRMFQHALDLVGEAV